MIYKTDKVVLRPLTRDTLNISRYREWINDPEVNKFNSHGIFPITEKEIDEFIGSINDGTNITWGIHGPSSHAHVGNIALQEIDYVNRSAELAIVIGDKDYCGIGMGTEACKLVVNHAFNKLNLNRVWLGTAELNKSMIAVAKKIGMEPEGRAINAFWYEDRYIDIVRYSIIRKK